MASGIRYFGDKRWGEITRDERFFCAELFRILRSPGQLEPFLMDLNSALQRQGETVVLPMNGWDMAFEAVFYRDLLHNRGIQIGSSGFSRKRTFDLAFFHDEHIVIIEAKAHQGLSSNQVGSFTSDKDRIRALFGESAPNIHLVLLCSEDYGSSKRAEAIRGEFDAVITWGRMAEIFALVDADAHQAFLRANGLRKRLK